MLKIYKYEELKPFSYFSIGCYVTFLVSMSTLFIPLFFNKTTKTFYSLIDILSLNFTSINILVGVLLFCFCLIFLFNFLFEPSWLTFFINVAIIIFMFISPLLLKGQLVPLLRIYNSTLSMHIGAILIMLCAVAYIALELYKISILDKFVNRNILNKRDLLMQKFKNAKKFYLHHSQSKNAKFKKHYRVRKPRVKCNVRYKRANLVKTAEYLKYLEEVYKI